MNTHWISFGSGLAALLFAGSVSAQIPKTSETLPVKPDKVSNHAEIQINQPFVSKAMGEFTLPFMWEAAENDSLRRLEVTESHTEQPAVITIDMLTIPKPLEARETAASVAKSVAESISAKAEIVSDVLKEECDKKDKCPELVIYKSQFSGMEKDVPRTCALEMVPYGSNSLIVLAMCRHSKRTYSPDMPEILHQILMLMK